MRIHPLAAATSALVLLTACAGNEVSRAPEPSATVRTLPTEFAADRFFVTPTLASGAQARFFTDTGGGFLIHEDSAKRLSLDIRTIGDGEERRTFTPFPAFDTQAWIPAPAADTRPPKLRNQLFVKPRSPHSDVFGDGMLGQEWFGGSVWIFDYPAQSLSWADSAQGMPFDPHHTVKLGFRANDSGTRGAHFPSIEATIDGKSLPFLFDTGATLDLSEDALAALGGGAKSRGTSFIVASVFDRWRQRHPEWRVIEKAENNRGAAPIIEVPQITIAGHTVGPVWFTKRPDANFHEFMSQWMDRRVEGALGGSAFKYFRIVADYPGARALFERAPGATP